MCVCVRACTGYFTHGHMSVQEERTKMIERIQNAGTEVVEAKAGAVSNYLYIVYSIR